VARRATLRASDADRDQIVERLRRACAEGRLAVHELEHRVAAALKARTYGELDATVADLPGQRTGARAPASRRALRTVQEHPALLVIAIPVALVVIATVVAITVLWMLFALVVVLLSQRRRYYHPPPWVYAPRRRFGPPYGAGPWR
jgi:hypothetical protein